MRVKRVLISVSDKDNLTDFARALSTLDIEIISTGGTAAVLRKSNIPITTVSDVTKFREMLDGRVKTLHPAIHGAILARRDDKKHMRQLKEQGITPIDMVVVNLYPFLETIKKRHTLRDAIENIDIGGPTLIRAAAKNYKHVAVVVNPSRYDKIIEELERNKNELSERTLSDLAAEAFRYTAQYDASIQRYFNAKFNRKEKFPEFLTLTYKKVRDLRYGENPHQEAAFYRELNVTEPCVTNATQLHGEKKISFNNILDLNDAFELVKEFDRPTVSVIKHTNPCGVASSDTLVRAYKRAHGTDTMSAFGCVIGLNETVDDATAGEIVKTFIEATIAPGYSKKAMEILKQKKNLRVLKADDSRRTQSGGFDIKRVVGGVLLQDRDLKEVTKKDLKVVSKRKPTKNETESMLFAWKVNRHVKSNSIVFSKNNYTVGIGAGQMSRVDAVKIAAMKSHGKSKGAVMASDAFFPFRDGIDEAARAGVTAVIQPGGSIRDQEIIDAVNQHGMAMVFTGVRCFKH